MARLDRLRRSQGGHRADRRGNWSANSSYPPSCCIAVVGRDEPWTLRAALAQLEDSELGLPLRRAACRARYTFKHALVQDTAYESLLKSRRQILHRKIADTLRKQFPDIVEAEPELLAHHFHGGGPLPGPRSNIGAGAGDLALYRSAFKEAIKRISGRR